MNIEKQSGQAIGRVWGTSNF